MKILLDECVPKLLKHKLSDHEVHTVTDLKWNGTKNGMLLLLCVNNGFDMLLTIDKNMMHQQNMEKFKITIVVFNSLTSKVEELINFIPSLNAQLSKLKKHHTYLIDI